MVQKNKKVINFIYSCSGDHDLRVPYTGTEAWTRSLGYKVIDEWRSWKVDGQIAGYVFLSK